MALLRKVAVTPRQVRLPRHPARCSQRNALVPVSVRTYSLTHVAIVEQALCGRMVMLTRACAHHGVRVQRLRNMLEGTLHAMHACVIVSLSAGTSTRDCPCPCPHVLRAHMVHEPHGLWD